MVSFVPNHQRCISNVATNRHRIICCWRKHLEADCSQITAYLRDTYDLLADIILNHDWILTAETALLWSWTTAACRSALWMEITALRSRMYLARCILPAFTARYHRWMTIADFRAAAICFFTNMVRAKLCITMMLVFIWWNAFTAMCLLNAACIHTADMFCFLWYRICRQNLCMTIMLERIWTKRRRHNFCRKIFCKRTMCCLIVW